MVGHPAAMAILGERIWYLPGWLAWLPAGTGTSPTTSVVRRFPGECDLR
jgi:hypothetical protein